MILKPREENILPCNQQPLLAAFTSTEDEWFLLMAEECKILGKELKWFVMKQVTLFITRYPVKNQGLKSNLTHFKLQLKQTYQMQKSINYLYMYLL